MPAPRKALALCVLLAATPAYAQMYKCVDERGVTHYSDKPRPDCKGVPVQIQASPPISGKVAPPAASSAAQQDADFRRRQAERERADAAGKAELEQRCTRLRRELASLSYGGRIAKTNSQGERVYVDDASRDARLSRIREELRGCPYPSAPAGDRP